MTRDQFLPAGWYPRQAAEVGRQCDEFLSGAPDRARDLCAAVVPHAGWTFSGRIACRTIARLKPGRRTVVVAGGHLRAAGPVLVAPEDTVATPLGTLAVDIELADAIRAAIPTADDTAADNTVEVHLPLIAHLLDMPKIVYLRVPPSDAAMELGRVIAEYAVAGNPVAMIGSTDLTHYGPSYGFTGHGNGAEAANWVRDTNDAPLVDQLLAMDPEGVLETAARDHSACSAGAAAAAITFARELGCIRAELVEYATSYDVMPGDSVVGYAGVGYGAERSSV